MRIGLAGHAGRGWCAAGVWVVGRLLVWTEGLAGVPWWRVDAVGRAWVRGEFEEGFEEFGGGAAAFAGVVVRPHGVVEGVEDAGEGACREEAGAEAAEIVDGVQEAGVVLGPDGDLADAAACGSGGSLAEEFGVQESGGGVGDVERSAGRAGLGAAAGAEGVVVLERGQVVWALIGLHSRRLACDGAWATEMVR